MSVTNKFYADSIRHSEENKTIYMNVNGGANYDFAYTIWCKFINGHMFFNIEKHVMTIILPNSGMRDPTFKTSVLVIMASFHIADDLPVASGNFLLDQGEIMQYISPEFKDKYASYLLDSVINERV
jgi:hypothetical protein